MALDIAVCVGKDGLTSSLYDAKAIVIYQKEEGNWNRISKKEISLDQQAGMAKLRQQMAGIGNFLGDCKIFIGKAVVGLPYFELEKMQCSIWEFEGNPLSLLDYVLEREEAKLVEKQPVARSAIPVPVERENGDYYLSIKEIQENGSGITSKQVLMPVLGQGNFYSLEVLCNHVPPWLEVELKDGKLVGRVEKLSPTETHIYISKRGCTQ